MSREVDIDTDASGLGEGDVRGDDSNPYTAARVLIVNFEGGGPPW